MDPDQTAPRSSLIWVHTVCQKAFKIFQQTIKADICCDWCFKGINLRKNEKSQ